MKRLTTILLLLAGMKLSSQTFNCGVMSSKMPGYADVLTKCDVRVDVWLEDSVLKVTDPKTNKYVLYDITFIKSDTYFKMSDGIKEYIVTIRAVPESKAFGFSYNRIILCEGPNGMITYFCN